MMEKNYLMNKRKEKRKRREGEGKKYVWQLPFFFFFFFSHPFFLDMTHQLPNLYLFLTSQ